jgi:hypothetical protein
VICGRRLGSRRGERPHPHRRLRSADARASRQQRGLGRLRSAVSPDQHRQAVRQMPAKHMPSPKKAINITRRMSRGFMGQTWDGGDVAFRPETWAEVLRVLKPGGHLSRSAGRALITAWPSRSRTRALKSATSSLGFTARDSRNRTISRADGAPRSSPRGSRSLCRKPLIGTVAANVLKHGTGAINIDGCRIGMSDDDKAAINAKHAGMDPETTRDLQASVSTCQPIPCRCKKLRRTLGRWPANIIHDGSDEVLAGFPAEAGSNTAKVEVRAKAGFANNGAWNRLVPPITPRGRLRFRRPLLLLRQGHHRRARRGQQSPDRKARRADALAGPARHSKGRHRARPVHGFRLDRARLPTPSNSISSGASCRRNMRRLPRRAFATLRACSRIFRLSTLVRTQGPPPDARAPPLPLPHKDALGSAAPRHAHAVPHPRPRSRRTASIPATCGRFAKGWGGDRRAARAAASACGAGHSAGDSRWGGAWCRASSASLADLIASRCAAKVGVEKLAVAHRRGAVAQAEG